MWWNGSPLPKSIDDWLSVFENKILNKFLKAFSITNDNFQKLSEIL